MGGGRRLSDSDDWSSSHSRESILKSITAKITASPHLGLQRSGRGLIQGQGPKALMRDPRCRQEREAALGFPCSLHSVALVVRVLRSSPLCHSQAVPTGTPG